MTTLRKKVEGKCTGRFGYTILVTSLTDVGKGRLDEDSGSAVFPVTYLALVFRPIRNEILNTRVTQVNQNGFFASAGPLEIFVSDKLMPSDLKFDAGRDGNPMYISEEENIRIEQDTEVRVKIIGIRLASDQIITIGTIKEDFLG
jgi:DNA-directed RNA polymerase II subunit RPB7